MNYSSLERASKESWRDVLQFMHTQTEGLTDGEVEKRFKEYGFNILEEPDKTPLWKKFLEQFTEPLIMLLLGSAVVSLILGQIDDAIGILVALIIVSTVAFVQELKSEQMVEALKKLANHMCVVVRNGQTSEVSADMLVPGDIVLLESGKRIPADMRVIESVGLLVDESMLTGESEPVSKSNEPMTQDTDSLHRTNCLYMGSIVCGGKAKCVVICTGNETELGKISKMIHEAEDPRTPLQLQMDLLGRQLSVMSMAIVLIICLIGLAQGRSLLKMFTIGVSLAVAAIPEGLPIVVTVTLALGVSRMAKKKAIIRKLPAVEALGAASVICSDKTGTLTRNEMTVTKIYAAGITVDVEGLGYEPVGHFYLQRDLFNPTSHPTFKRLLEVGILCNDAIITRGEGLIGQPTEGAILCCSMKAGLIDNRKQVNYTEQILFSSATKWMGKAYTTTAGTQEFVVKGAPEVILEKCTHIADYKAQDIALTPATRTEMLKIIKALSSEGLRVVALAAGPSMQELTWLGVVGIIDPPRDGVVEAIYRTKIGGIKIAMLTGDSEDTAKAIGRKLSIYDEQEGHLAMSGREVSAKSEQELCNLVDRTTIFYRVTPQDKMKIVQAFRKNGHVVAVTGDGVNDAPALKAADIGIAMGKSGTDVCKEASEMILVDDNFVTIISAIEEGKSIFDNTRNFLRFQLTTSISALSIIALSTLFDFHIPFNAIQILWINIIMDGPPAQSLGVEPPHDDLMKTQPRNTSTSVISDGMKRLITSSSVVMIMGTLFVYFDEADATDLEENQKAMTMGFTTFVFFQMFNAWNCRSFEKSVLLLGWSSNKPLLWSVCAVILMQFVVVYVPFFQYIFSTVPLSLGDMALVISVSSSVLVVDEVRKFMLRKPRKDRLMLPI